MPRATVRATRRVSAGYHFLHPTSMDRSGADLYRAPSCLTHIPRIGLNKRLGCSKTSLAAPRWIACDLTAGSRPRPAASIYPAHYPPQVWPHRSKCRPTERALSPRANFVPPMRMWSRHHQVMRSIRRSRQPAQSLIHTTREPRLKRLARHRDRCIRVHPPQMEATSEGAPDTPPSHRQDREAE